MSLQFIIDGYNVIHHPIFTQQVTQKAKYPKSALLEFIKKNRLCGSSRNKIMVVFDGYPEPSSNKTASDTNIVFSGNETADEKIKRVVESSDNPKNIIVVSDDKEIKFFAKVCGAKAIGVEEFIPTKEKKAKDEDDLLKAELTYAQIDKINKELRKIWLERGRTS